jgi:MFS family permease
MVEKKKNNLWLVIILFGLFGQIAWQIENMLFNIYVYNTIVEDTLVIALMVSFSSIVATLTTIFVGAYSDRKGIKKGLICYGYIAWGLSTILFGLASISNISWLFHLSQPVLFASILAIILDCIMTLFGSSANDVAFNIFVTEKVDAKQRGKVEGILSMFGPLAGLIVVGLSMIILDPDQADPTKWTLYYFIIGLLVSLVGVLGFFFIGKDEKVETPKTNSIWSDIIYGLRPSTLKNNKLLYIGLLGILIQGISFQTYYPYLIVYIQHVLFIEDYTIIMVVIVLGTSAIGAITGLLVDKIGHIKLILPLIAISLAGFIVLFFAKDVFAVSLGGTLSMAGELAISIVFLSLHRANIPKGKEGQFQGVRIISAVLIPMLTGPFIGSALADGSNYYTELGETKVVPSHYMFIASAIIILLITIPTILLKAHNHEKKETINS